MGQTIGAVVCNPAIKTFGAEPASIDAVLMASPLADETGHITGIFHKTFRIVIDPEVNACFIRAERLESHDACIVLPGDASPSDALVGDLFINFGIPFALLPADLGLPMQPLIIQ